MPQRCFSDASRVSAMSRARGVTKRATRKGLSQGSTTTHPAPAQPCHIQTRVALLSPDTTRSGTHLKTPLRLASPLPTQRSFSCGLVCAFSGNSSRSTTLAGTLPATPDLEQRQQCRLVDCPLRAETAGSWTMRVTPGLITGADGRADACRGLLLGPRPCRPA